MHRPDMHDLGQRTRRAESSLTTWKVTRAVTLGAAVALALASCKADRLLKVPDPDVLPPSVLLTESALPALRNGAIGDFQVAYSGAGDLQNNGHEGQVNMSGLLSDEFINAETFDTRIAVDQRRVQPANGSMIPLFLDLSKARASAEFAAKQYQQFQPDSAGRAEALGLGGSALILFAENYCEGVPLSTLALDGSLTFGEPLTRNQLLDSAILKLDSAARVATAAGDDRLLSLAKVAKGRALLDKGDAAGAAAAVTGVPTSFQYVIEHSANSTRQYNGIWNYTFNVAAFSVADSEGVNGKPFFSANDPRVPVTSPFLPSGDVVTGFDNTTPFFQQRKYPTNTTGVVLADGIEARLIEAEAALKAGNTTGEYSILNTLRASISLPSLPVGATPTAREDALFHERAFWLYLTSHRVGDMRRLVRQYARGTETVFPTGTYFKGGTYGTDVNFPISADELNNPNFKGCLNRNA